MKKSIISLIVVLFVTMALMVGCAADAGSQEGNPNGNGRNNAAGYAENANIGRGDNGTCSNGKGGNSHGQQAGQGDDCDPSKEYEPAASSAERESSETDTAALGGGYGASGALADESLTLSEMLTYAAQDEYLAHAEYAYILATFGNSQPFGNIIKAEEQHIEALLPLFSEYGIEAPVDTGSDHAVAVSSLTEAYKAGEKAEVDNIAMYEEFLKQDLPENVRAIFESLQKASENHLAAFRNHL